ncbi:MAG: hypothetical protein GX130_07935 [Candidatus Hydrogenedens sp.]|nr:hypothetical protein [Candidatus Hydrogenedens sp.]
MDSHKINRRAFVGTLAAGAFAAGLGQRSIFAVGGGGQRRIASFVCDVTPPLGTPIYSSMQPLEVIEHPLLAKGIVLEDSGGRSVLCAIDYCLVRNSLYDLYRKEIAEAAGTSIDRVAVHTVHQHTAPLADSDAQRLLEGAGEPVPGPSVESFEAPAGIMAAAVKEALTDLQPYDSLGTSMAKVERVASNRRVPIGEGKVGFRASSCKDPELIEKPEGLIDPMLKTVTFAFEGKPLVQLHYYATHPQSFYGDPRATYDFVGMARERLEKESGVPQIYFTGCEGDVAAGKYNDASKEAREGLYERLYAAMKSASNSPHYRPAQDAIWRTVPLRLAPRNDESYNEAHCRSLLANVEQPALARISAAMYVAWLERNHRPLDLTLMRLGDLVFVHLPGEPMVEFQLYAQSLLPHDFVAVAALGDGAPAYICPDRVYEEGGYESRASHSAPGADVLFRDAIKKLLVG